VALYRTFLTILNSIPLNGEKIEAPEPAALEAARRNLQTLPPRARQAFLLVALEEFTPADAALAMNVSDKELDQLIDEAGR
jgi:DNA-directed RNA polymerase specialized sigma24 family protein